MSYILKALLTDLIYRRTATMGHLGVVTPKLFLCFPKFVVPRKIIYAVCFKHIMKSKINTRKLHSPKP